MSCNLGLRYRNVDRVKKMDGGSTDPLLLTSLCATLVVLVCLLKGQFWISLHNIFTCYLFYI